MRRESNWRTRDNPLHLDLFERSSQSLSSNLGINNNNWTMQNRNRAR